MPFANAVRLWAAPVPLLLTLLLTGCGSRAATGPPLFERLPPEETGVTFVNEVPLRTDFNIINYLYYYDGGGVALGDVNQDGRVDLYFTSNLGPNRLYLNQGDFQFKDVTAAAGVAGTGDWTTGVTMADVNGDGLLDIYVCVVDYLGKHGHNQLYINQGVGPDGKPTFVDQSKKYGLAFSGYSVQAAFFDYDRDGDLDMYLLNHSTHDAGTVGRAHLRKGHHPKAGDRLYRNEGGHFTDVTAEAGIYSSKIGYGLGVVVSDLNRDGWPDIYVANDFHENDYLYYNNGDGTFSERIETATGHTSYSSMGVDAADVTGDGRPEIAVLDMRPRREAILKTSEMPTSYVIYRFKRTYGYHHQLARNTLQLNWGEQRFSDIGFLAGVAATDWSWAPLFADFDLDGDKDLFVTNGIYRRPNDLDYIKYVSNEIVQASLKQGITKENLTLIERMPQVKLPNHVFRNDSALAFTDVTEEWGLSKPSYSNGAAYGDLDNDGDLDLVINNVNAPAAIYENQADTLTDHHYLTIVLRGSEVNTMGIGAKVILKNDGTVQLLEQMPTRGFQSAVEPRLHFGLGAATSVDSLIVVWPDGRAQALTDVAANQTLVLHQENANGAWGNGRKREREKGGFETHEQRPPTPPLSDSPSPLFTDVTGTLSLGYTHEEDDFIDFTREPLMPHMLSTEGPPLAVGDVNGDGLDDFYVGGAKGQAGQLFVQQPDGSFSATNDAVWQADSLHEDTGATFFDAEGDGDLDLYVASGGNELWGKAEALRDRLYLNQGGDGRFRRPDTSGALPPFYDNTACVLPADYDGDGDTDLFVGSRVVTKNYGADPRSHLLINDGTGHFTDATGTLAPELERVGMVTDATWADLDGNDRLDLVVVGEWMPITVFYNRGGGRLERARAKGLEKSHGWWNAVLAEDFDRDGDIDLVAGNLGMNSRLRAAPETPVKLYLNDFDDNGSVGEILTYVQGDARYPVASLDLLIEQIPSLRETYPTYASFGGSRLEDIFTDEQLEAARVERVYTFATAFIENAGNGTFTLRPLPMRAQLTPVQSLLAGDFTGDGRFDLLLGGNFYGVRPSAGRYDAGYGLLLKGTEPGRLNVVQSPESNLWIEGAVRDLVLLRRAGGGRLLLVARNDASLQVLRVEAPAATATPHTLAAH